MNKPTGSRRTKVILAVIGLMLVCCLAVEGVAVYRMVNTPSFRQAFSQVSGDLIAMSDLQQEVRAQFPAESVSINITNGKILTVSLINPSDLDASASGQKEQARQVALYVKAHFQEIQKIESIRITFVKQKSISFFSASQSFTYIFTKDELGSGSSSG
jgi:hypothetical protein